MSRPVIAVDIDEVLARHNFALAAWHNERFGTTHTEHDYFTEYWSRIWHTDEEETERRAAAFQSHGIYRDLPVVEGSYAGLKRLSQTYDLVVVTVRRQSVIDATHLWLQGNFPSLFKDIRFIHFWDKGVATSKAEVAAEMGASYLIDDSLKHCTLAAQEGIEALLFGDYTWNKAETLPRGIHRVKGWSEIMEHFNER